jgi:hypothetical protein
MSVELPPVPRCAQVLARGRSLLRLSIFVSMSTLSNRNYPCDQRPINAYSQHGQLSGVLSNVPPRTARLSEPLFHSLELLVPISQRTNRCVLRSVSVMGLIPACGHCQSGHWIPSSPVRQLLRLAGLLVVRGETLSRNRGFALRASESRESKPTRRTTNTVPARRTLKRFVARPYVPVSAS